MKSHDVRRSIQVSAAGEMDVIWYLADSDRNQSGKLSSMNHAGISRLVKRILLYEMLLSEVFEKIIIFLLCNIKMSDCDRTGLI
jgi:hypothetical protein